MSKPDRTYRNVDLADLPGFADMVGPRPPDWFESNGCSNAPDVLFGADLRPAAHFHDWAYCWKSAPEYKFNESGKCWGVDQPLDSLDETVRDEFARYKADRNFLANLKTCRLFGLFRFVYYSRVRFWGHFHFDYSNGFEPNHWSPLFWLRLFFGRYVEM